ncbi:protein DpdG [Kitasatospora sp. NPDC008115]|uniref:protein DpdG n=1 Tax=Kitasatospora sp. NPDC008115 TaxID=3364022 RepID=UPI0036E5A1D1
MAVLNPPRSLPGLGRAVISFLNTDRRSWTDETLVEAFKPPGLNDDKTSAAGVQDTLSAFRAIGMLTRDKNGVVTVTEGEHARGALTQAQFRRAVQRHVMDLSRDGDPWNVSAGDAYTSGARDLLRALSWFLAQDPLGRPLSWNENVQGLQDAQFGTSDNETWAVVNDTRWPPFSRWAKALGLASPSLLKSAPGLVPLPVVAIDDVLDELPEGRMTIVDFLAHLAVKLPVLHGGSARATLVATRLENDPDPGVLADCADSSVGQALRILEERGRVVFSALPDATGLRLLASDSNRHTHVTLARGGKR